MIQLSLKEKETLTKTVKVNGMTAQMLLLIQELAELQQAITELLIALEDGNAEIPYDAVLSEWADVWICLQYIPYTTLLGSCELEEAVHQKIARLQRWLEAADFQTARKIDREWERKLP